MIVGAEAICCTEIAQVCLQCARTAEALWLPAGSNNGAEARLERFGPQAYPGHQAWPLLTSWWLKHTNGATTPNWDIALSCEIQGRPGLILVEAKANVSELRKGGKRLDREASPNTLENHSHIGDAIDDARVALDKQLHGIQISRDSSYQLSNRIAFAWKLASLGIPTVLVYLGFIGDQGIWQAGAQFDSDAHWQRIFREHLSRVCPLQILDGPIRAGEADFWLQERSRPVINHSPLAIPRARARIGSTL